VLRKVVRRCGVYNRNSLIVVKGTGWEMNGKILAVKIGWGYVQGIGQAVNFGLYTLGSRKPLKFFEQGSGMSTTMLSELWCQPDLTSSEGKEMDVMGMIAKTAIC
jgi:hypothetical protein